MLHVYPYLVRTAGLQFALDQSYIVEPLDDLIVGHGPLAVFPFRIHPVDTRLAVIAADMIADRSLVLLYISPNQGVVSSVNGMIKELLG